MNDPGNDSVGLNSALQSALSAPSIHQQAFQSQHILQAQQMVNPQPGGPNQPAQLRSLIPRQGPNVIAANAQGFTLVTAPIVNGRGQTFVPVYGNGRQMAAFVADGSAPLPAWANQTAAMIQIVPQTQTRMVAPQLLNRPGTGVQMVTQSPGQMVRIPHQLVQQRSTTAQPQSGNSNDKPEVVTIDSESDPSTPVSNNPEAMEVTEGGEETEEGAFDEGEMPVLDRQDKTEDLQESADSEESDEYTRESRETFLKEAESFNLTNPTGKPVLHYTSGGIPIMEAKEPFATKPEQFVDQEVKGNEENVVEEVPKEVEQPPLPKRRKPTVEEREIRSVECREKGTTGRGRRGRPAGSGRGRGGGRPSSRRSDQSEQDSVHQERGKRRVKEEERTPTPPAKSQKAKAPTSVESGEKGKRKRRTEADRLVDMDFGPLAGERILSGNRRRSQPTNLEKKTRRTQRSSEFHGGGDESGSEETTEEEYSPYDRESYETRSRRSPRRRTSQSIKDEEEDEPEEEEEEQVGRKEQRKRGLLVRDGDSSTMSIEVVGQEQMSIPTEVPSISRLRRASALYTVEALPGCEESVGSKPGTLRESASRQPGTSKASYTAQKIISAKNKAAKMLADLPPKKEIPSKPSTPDRNSSPSTSESSDVATPSEPIPPPIVKEETPSSFSRTSSTKDLSSLGNPENWNLQTTCEVVDEGMRAFCFENGLDAYVLAYGGETLENLRKNVLKMPDGQKVSLGPWRKLTSTIRDYLKPYATQKSAIHEHGLNKSSTRTPLYKWIERITDRNVVSEMQMKNVDTLVLQQCTPEELHHFLKIKIGQGLKIWLAVNRLIEEGDWPLNVWLTGSAPKVPEFSNWNCESKEYYDWLSFFIDNESIEKIHASRTDINTLFHLTTEEFVTKLHLYYGTGKTIQAAIKIIRDAGKGPTRNFEETDPGVLGEDIFKGNNFIDWLTAEFDPIDIAPLKRWHLASAECLWFTCEEMDSWPKIPYGLLKRFKMKVAALLKKIKIPPRPAFMYADPPPKRVDQWTVKDVENWFEKFMKPVDEAVFNKFVEFGVDGKTLAIGYERLYDRLTTMTRAITHEHLMKAKIDKTIQVEPLESSFLTCEGEKLKAWLSENVSQKSAEFLAIPGMKGRYLAYYSPDDLTQYGLRYADAVKIEAFWRRSNLSPEEDVFIPTGPPVYWTPDDFYQWVATLTSKEEAEKLKAECVEATNFDTLHPDDFKEMGISPGAYKAMLSLYKKIKKEGPYDY